MKIILQKPVEKLGVPGDVVEVADGYARNFLLPRGIAVQATKGGVRHIGSLKRAHDQRVTKARAEAETLAGKLVGSSLTVRARVGEEGRLFGSITSTEIAAAIESELGVSVDRHDIHLDDAIRSVGAHEVKVRLHPDVQPVLSVRVEPGE